MILEGERLALEALGSGARLRQAVVCPSRLAGGRGRALLAGLRRLATPCHEASVEVFDWLADAASPQGVLLLAEHPAVPPGHLIASAPQGALVLMPCGVQDPGNMGALVRLAEAGGAAGLIAAGGADPFGPKAARASAGSILRLPVARDPAPASAARFASLLKSRGFLLAGAEARGGIDYRQGMPAGGLVLALGGEGAGLPAPLASMLDVRLTIPIAAPVESLNVAAAAAVLIFAASPRAAISSPRGPARRPEASPRPGGASAPPREGPPPPARPGRGRSGARSSRRGPSGREGA